MVYATSLGIALYIKFLLFFSFVSSYLLNNHRHGCDFLTPFIYSVFGINTSTRS
jgi:hypothetical protein